MGSCFTWIIQIQDNKAMLRRYGAGTSVEIKFSYNKLLPYMELSHRDQKMVNWSPDRLFKVKHFSPLCGINNLKAEDVVR